MLQESFIAASRAFDTLEDHSNFRAWVYRIIQRKAFDLRRKLQCLAEEEQTYDVSDARSEDEFLRIEAEELLARSRKILSAPDLKEVFELCIVDGKDYDVVAKEIGCPIGTIKSRLHRARQALKTSLLLCA